MTQSTPKGERIAKIISRSGAASRRDAEKMILAGRVKVNGRKIDSPALNINADDEIKIDNAPLRAAEPTRLWLYHKPKGLVTSARDEKGRPTVFSALPSDLPRVMSVGRLDLNSEGLLLLTNDGELKRQLELPSTGWMRRYRVRINGRLNAQDLEPLSKGMTVEGAHFKPMMVQFDRQQGANAWITLGLREGKNREIRRSIEHLGFTVTRLIRISYGPFQLRTLAVGTCEEVKARVLADQMGWHKEAPKGNVGKAPRRPHTVRKRSSSKARP